MEPAKPEEYDVDYDRDLPMQLKMFVQDEQRKSEEAYFAQQANGYYLPMYGPMYGRPATDLYPAPYTMQSYYGGVPGMPQVYTSPGPYGGGEGARPYFPGNNFQPGYDAYNPPQN